MDASSELPVFWREESGCTCLAIIIWRVMLFAEWGSESSNIVSSVMAGSRHYMYSPLFIGII